MTKLKSIETSMGLAGRVLVTYGRYGNGRRKKGGGEKGKKQDAGAGDSEIDQLPPHRFRNGDIAAVYANNSFGESLDEGIVYRVTETTITMAFDGSDRNMKGNNDGDNSSFRLDKLANQVSYNRMKFALNCLPQYSEKFTNSLPEIVIGARAPSFHSSVPPVKEDYRHVIHSPIAVSPPTANASANVTVSKGGGGRKRGKTKKKRKRPNSTVPATVSTPATSAEFSVMGPDADGFTPFNPRLDESQIEAIKFALRASDVALIHGPPGTGKTTTIIEYIQQEVVRGKRILVTAPSNIAVDNIVLRLNHLNAKDSKSKGVLPSYICFPIPFCTPTHTPTHSLTQTLSLPLSLSHTKGNLKNRP